MYEQANNAPAYGTPIIVVPGRSNLRGTIRMISLVDQNTYNDLAACLGLPVDQVEVPSPPEIGMSQAEVAGVFDPEQDMHMQRLADAAIDKLLSHTKKPSPLEAVKVIEVVFRNAELHYPQMSRLFKLFYYICEKEPPHVAQEPTA